MRIGGSGLAVLLGLALACGSLTAAEAAPKPNPTARAAKPQPARAVRPRTATGVSRLRFRPARTAATHEAERAGALVGNGCNGRAQMQRDDHQWVVLCSNGKTYVVDSPQHAAATECSLAGIGPEPACFP